MALMHWAGGSAFPHPRAPPSPDDGRGVQSRFPSLIAASSGLMPGMRVSAASPTAVLAVAAGCMGLLVMLGWTVRIPLLLTFGLGTRSMPFDAGLGLALAGFVWAWVARGDKGA